MRLLKRLIISLVVLVALLSAVAYLLPRHVIVTRSIVINTAPEAIFPLINSLQEVEKWSPWMSKDPNIKTTYSGPETGLGNKMAWESEHPNVGNGSETITESIANAHVATDLDFGEMGTAKAAFDLSATDGGTEVRWSLDADMGMSPIGRWMGLFMDKMVGPDYEQGLTNLKAVAEAG